MAQEARSAESLSFYGFIYSSDGWRLQRLPVFAGLCLFAVDPHENFPGLLSTPSVAGWSLDWCTTGRCAQGGARLARVAARSRVGLPESVAPAAASNPERR